MAQLSQSIQWNDVGVGAYYQVLVNPPGGGTALKVFDAGQNVTSAVLADILAGVDLAANPIVDLHVQSLVGLPNVMPSGWSSPALQVTITGFPTPNPPTLV